MIKRIFTTVSLIFAFSLSFAQTYNGPESVEFDYANNRWLIANTASHQVLARSTTGVLTVFTTLTGSGPYGIEIMGDTLYCCNGSSIKGFSLTTGTLVFNITVTGATFLNGITHDNSGNLIATDFSAKNIYKINPGSNSFFPIATSLVQSPNGIIFDAANNRCVFVNWGSNAPIKAIDLATNVVSTVTTTTFSNIDGITRDGNGNYYIATWGTQSVYKYDSTFSAAGVQVVNSLSNPADIFYNVLSDTLAIPNAGNNTVTFVGFTTTGIKNAEVKGQLTIYPNPCSTSCRVRIKSADHFPEVTLRSVDGKIIRDAVATNLFASDEIEILFDRSKLVNGMYFLEMKNRDQYYFGKLIIE